MPGTLLPHEILDELPRWPPHRRRGACGSTTATSSWATGCRPRPTSSSTRSTRPSSAWSSGRRLLPRTRSAELATGLFLQDIGKLALPPTLVHKPGPLAPDEWELMMQHPLLGLEFLRDDSISAAAKSVVRSHHERWDGSGYPGGLVGEEISLFARIAAVADVFDAVTSERFHAPAVPPQEGVEIDPRGLRHRVRPGVVEAFLAVVGALVRAGRAPRRRSSRRRSRGGGRRPRDRRTGRSA